MTDAERAAVSATRFARVVLDAPSVKADLPSVLSIGSPDVRVTQPPAIAASLQFGTAAFGPRIGSPNVSAIVVAAVDAANAAGSNDDRCVHTAHERGRTRLAKSAIF